MGMLDYVATDPSNFARIVQRFSKEPELRQTIKNKLTPVVKNFPHSGNTERCSGLSPGHQIPSSMKFIP
jgi:hypothetical protein